MQWSCSRHVYAKKTSRSKIESAARKKICFSRTSRKPEPLRAAQRDPKIESRSVSWIGSTIVAARRKRTTGEKGEENPFSLNFSELATSGPPLALSTRETFRFQLEKNSSFFFCLNVTLSAGKDFQCQCRTLIEVGSLNLLLSQTSFLVLETTADSEIPCTARFRDPSPSLFFSSLCRKYFTLSYLFKIA